MIFIPILTRHNPLKLITLINSLDELANKPDEINYMVRYDEDDYETPIALALLNQKFPYLMPVCRPRPANLGQAWNECLSQTLAWDIAIPFPDDIIPLCDKWDIIVRMAVKDHPACSWFQLCSPNFPMYPIFTRQYYDACQRQVFPEWFPFWESDRWFWERHELAFGKPLQIIKNLALGGKHAPTKNMRDVAFWFDFYDATRNDRVREAKYIQQYFSVQSFDIDGIVKQQEKIYQNHMAHATMYQKSNNPNPGAPSEAYLQAKQRAINYLADRPCP